MNLDNPFLQNIQMEAIMEIISFIGLIVGISVFILMLTKSYNLVLAGVIGAIIISATSGMGIMTLMTVNWAAGFAGFLKNYFIIFVLGSLFGRMLNDGGGAKRIAIGLLRVFTKMKGDPRFWAAAFVPALYGLLSYVGVSGYVVIYTVIDIAVELFVRLDVPWRLYTNGGTSSMGIAFAPASLSIINIAPIAIIGTSNVSSAPIMGIVATAMFYLTMAFWIKYDLKQADKRGEGFMKTGSAYVEGKTFKNINDEDMSKLPTLWQAVIPMVVMIVLAGVFKVNVIIAELVGIILCAVTMFKFYGDFKESVGGGLSQAYTPIIGVAATSAIGSLIKVVPGFKVIAGALGFLPGIYEGIALISVITWISASGAAAMSSFGQQVFEVFTENGLSADVSHRLMVVSSFTGVPFHSSGVNNAIAVAKLEYKYGIICYIRNGLTGGFLALLAIILMIKFGFWI